MFGLGFAGLTTNVSVLELTLLCVATTTPFDDHVTFQGPIPVSAACTVVEPPLHIVTVPLTTEVGRGLTVTTALAVRSSALAAQFASLNAVTV